MSLLSLLVLTRRAWEQGLAIVHTGAHQGSLGTNLAQGLYSILVLTWRAWEQA